MFLATGCSTSLRKEPPEVSQPRLPTPLCLSGSTTASSPAAIPPQGLRWGFCELLEGRRLEQGFFLNGKIKIIRGTSHSSKSRVYSAPLARKEGCSSPLETIALQMGGVRREMSGGGVSVLLPSLADLWNRAPE